MSKHRAPGRRVTRASHREPWTRCPVCNPADYARKYARHRGVSMSANAPDPDLPGDEAFRSTGPSAEVVINGMFAMTVSPEEQAAIHHDRLRYAELQKVHLGLANRYVESRYR